MIITIIVPCRNERRHVGEFIDSLSRQIVKPDWELEILIADGGSNDGTRQILEQYASRMSSIRIVDNPGRIVSAGLNAALAQAHGDIILRFDVHTSYAEDYIVECIRALQNSGADNVGGPWIAEGKGLWGKAIAAAFRSRFCCGGNRAHDPQYEGEVDTVYLGCWPRSVFERIGLFDERLVRNQDDEFNFRLLRSGGRIWQTPRIKSSYVARSSMTGVFRQYLQYGFWKVAVIRKHRGLASWRHAIPVLFVTSLLLLPLLVVILSVFGCVHAASLIGVAFLSELALYAVASSIAAAAFVRVLSWKALPLLPPIFAVHHAAYGLGFLVGILASTNSMTDKGYQRSLFTVLTR